MRNSKHLKDPVYDLRYKEATEKMAQEGVASDHIKVAKQYNVDVEDLLFWAVANRVWID
jgi:hypothetical protein